MIWSLLERIMLAREESIPLPPDAKTNKENQYMGHTIWETGSEKESKQPNVTQSWPHQKHRPCFAFPPHVRQLYPPSGRRHVLIMWSLAEFAMHGFDEASKDLLFSLYFESRSLRPLIITKIHTIRMSTVHLSTTLIESAVYTRPYRRRVEDCLKHDEVKSRPLLIVSWRITH